jgi:hypothetical protein
LFGNEHHQANQALMGHNGAFLCRKVIVQKSSIRLPFHPCPDWRNPTVHFPANYLAFTRKNTSQGHKIIHPISLKPSSG